MPTVTTQQQNDWQLKWPHHHKSSALINMRSCHSRQCSERFVKQWGLNSGVRVMDGQLTNKDNLVYVKWRESKVEKTRLRLWLEIKLIFEVENGWQKMRSECCDGTKQRCRYEGRMARSTENWEQSLFNVLKISNCLQVKNVNDPFVIKTTGSSFIITASLECRFKLCYILNCEIF